jgi:hypothetical protein
LAAHAPYFAASSLTGYARADDRQVEDQVLLAVRELSARIARLETALAERDR